MSNLSQFFSLKSPTIVGTMKFIGSISGFVGLKGPATGSSVTFTLPSTDGTAGQALTTDGAGNMSFTSTSKQVSSRIFYAMGA